MNYFNPKTAAKQYAQGRPYFHEQTVALIRDFLKLEDKVDKALDIASGTGLSTQALLPIANEVVGTDASQEMLNLAQRSDKIVYLRAEAEKQPFDNETFDLITVCSGVHWFDIDAFLLEAHRLLKPNAWLVIYDNFFTGEMLGHEEFSQWYSRIYLKKFPPPPRNNQYTWTNEHLAPKKLSFISQEQFKNEVSFTKQQLKLYFTTQSNIISAVEHQLTNYQEVEQWLDDELSVYFQKSSIQTIYFGNWIYYIQK